MTAKQDAFYWREWGALSRRCRAEGWTVPDRHALHARALGCDKSHKVFNNADFDQILGVFRGYSQAENVDAQLRQIAQPAARKHAKIEQLMQCLALYVTDAETYVGHICRDKFGAADWNDLSDVPPPRRGAWQPPSQQEQLIMTLSRALNGSDGFRNQAGHTLAQMHALAASAIANVPVTVPADGDPEW